MTQRQAAVAADVANQTWINVEKGDSVKPNTLAGVDVAMQWEPGSAQDVLEGGEPRPLPPAAPLSENERLDRLERRLDELDQALEAERAANQRLRDELLAEQRRRRELHEAPSGESAQRPA